MTTGPVRIDFSATISATWPIIWSMVNRKSYLVS